MNFIYYCKIDEPDNTDLFEAILRSLPDADINKLGHMRLRADQWRSMIGKVLLDYALRENGLWCGKGYPTTGVDRFGRPYLKNLSVDFNISHAEDMVACALSLHGRIGCDVEKIRPVDLSDYQSVFNRNEWSRIILHDRPVQEFFRYWTRKEAFLKATGTGFLRDPAQIDLTPDTLWHDRRCWQITDLRLEGEYAAAVVASDSPGPHVRKVPVSTLRSVHRDKKPDVAFTPALQTIF